jgi:5-methylcytosine-specific restriction endonuclease McrA
MASAISAYSKSSRWNKMPKRRNCLRCDREFWSEGPHHRLCQVCRQVIAASPSPVEEYSLAIPYGRGVSEPKHTGQPWV